VEPLSAIDRADCCDLQSLSCDGMDILQKFQKRQDTFWSQTVSEWFGASNSKEKQLCFAPRCASRNQYSSFCLMARRAHCSGRCFAHSLTRGSTQVKSCSLGSLHYHTARFSDRVSPCLLSAKISALNFCWSEHVLPHLDTHSLPLAGFAVSPRIQCIEQNLAQQLLWFGLFRLRLFGN
jgi:hypothetical protein